MGILTTQDSARGFSTYVAVNIVQIRPFASANFMWHVDIVHIYDKNCASKPNAYIQNR